MVMRDVGLTRGGFYNHFKNKEALHSEAVSSFLGGRGAEWRDEMGVKAAQSAEEMTQRMIKGYLSVEHLGDLDAQCPMIALPSDVARANTEVKDAYQTLLLAMVSIFEAGVAGPKKGGKKASRQKALSLAALCVGGMVLARTLPESDLAEEVREAAYITANKMGAE